MAATAAASSVRPGLIVRVSSRWPTAPPMTLAAGRSGTRGQRGGVGADPVQQRRVGSDPLADLALDVAGAVGPQVRDPVAVDVGEAERPDRNRDLGGGGPGVEQGDRA